MNANTLETAAHVVQLALTPVFLLSGIAALLNVFASRLARVADQVRALGSETGEDALRAGPLLRVRSQALDWAVVLAALAGALNCGAVLVLFLGAVRGTGAANLLFLLFGGAIVLTMGALLAFTLEVLLATRSLRRTVGRLVGLVRLTRDI